MPLCPQITITPITVTSTGMTQTSVIDAGVPATTAQANTALADAAAALAEAQDAYAAAIGSLQPSANTIVNASNQITAINGTGITVYSGASATSGARVVLNSVGLAGFNAAGSATFSVSASTGAAVFSGDVTGATITGGTLNIGGNAIINSSGFLTATGATITGTITSSTITGGTVQTSSGGTAVVMDATTNSIGFKNGGTYSGFLTPIGSGAVIMHFGTTPSVSAYPRTSVSSTTASLAANTSNSISITTTGNNMVGDMNFLNYVKFTQSVDVMKAFNAFDEIYAIFGAATTVTNTPNTWMSTSGQIRRSTSSSIRYKENVTNLVDIDELHPKKLLDLPVRAFTYKQEYLSASDDRYEQLFPGFIAEEVDAVYPMAADYEKGNVESWNDRILIPGMLALIQDLYKEIKALKGE